MYAEIAGAIQSAKVLGDLLKAAKGLTNYNEFVTAVYEVNSKLMEATGVALANQEKHSALAERVADLEREVRDLRETQNDRQRYQLNQFEFGTYAYSLRPGMENGEPNHYLCASCMDQRKKSILQPAGENRLRCPACKALISTSMGRPGSPRGTRSWRTI